MALLNIAQRQLDAAELVLIVGKDGLYEWSSDRSKEDVADYLERLADAIRCEPPRA